MSTVTRRAVGFKFGSYPSKRFECSREQFVGANGASGTVPVGLNPLTRDHYVGEPNDLDGITGTASFAVDESGDLLPLQLDLPEWVSGLVDAKGYKLSAVFDGPESRKLLKFDFVERPAVAEAVVFSDGREEEAEVAVGFALPGEADHLQRHHDVLAASMGGACCDPSYQPARRSLGDRAAAAMHDYFVRQGARCATPNPSAKGPTAMSEATTNETDREPVTLSADELARKLQDETVKLSAAEKKLQKLVTDAIKVEATTFSAELSGGAMVKAAPAEAKAAGRLFAALSKLDRDRDGVVTFSNAEGKDDSAPALVDLLRAVYDAREAKPKNAGVTGFSLPPEPDNADPAAVAKREAARKRNQAAANPHVATA